MRAARRQVEVTEAGKVIYKTEHLPAPRLRQAGNAVGRFPEPGDEELIAGPSRNFQVFDPLDFLAEVTQHIPDPGEHLIRYYGWYSNKSRGQRAKGQAPPAAGASAAARSPSAREARKGWACLRADTHRQAALIKQVYEADPLCCPCYQHVLSTTIRVMAGLPEDNAARVPYRRRAGNAREVVIPERATGELPGC